MTDLVLINGCGGAGKDTAGRLLLHSVDHAALLDIKSMSWTQPWEFNEYHIGLRNAANVIGNYFEAGYPLVILSGGLSTQGRIDYFVAILPAAIRIHYFWLAVSKELRDARRILRRRDDADNAEYLDRVDAIFTDPGELTVPSGTYTRVNADALKPEEVVMCLNGALSSVT